MLRCGFLLCPKDNSVKMECFAAKQLSVYLLIMYTPVGI